MEYRISELYGYGSRELNKTGFKRGPANKINTICSVVGTDTKIYSTYNTFIAGMRALYSPTSAQYLAIQIIQGVDTYPYFIIERSSLYVRAVTFDIYNDTMQEVYKHFQLYENEKDANNIDFNVRILNHKTFFIYFKNENYTKGKELRIRGNSFLKAYSKYKTRLETGSGVCDNSDMRIIAFFLAEAVRFIDIEYTCKYLFETNADIIWDRYLTLMQNWSQKFAKAIVLTSICRDIKLLCQYDLEHDKLMRHMNGTDEDRLARNILQFNQVRMAFEHRATHLAAKNKLGMETAIKMGQIVAASTAPATGLGYEEEDEAFKAAYEAALKSL